MAENKFVAKLRGKATPKSVVEIKKDKVVVPLTGAPNSSPFTQGIIDDTESSVIVAKAAQNWILDDRDLTPTDDFAYIGEAKVEGDNIWVNGEYTFPASQEPTNPVVAIINPSSKWVFRMVGKNLFSDNEYVPFALVLMAGPTAILTREFTVRREAGFFCKKFILDFADTTQDLIKVNEGEELTLQLICQDPSATATVFYGASVLSLLQRKIDGADVNNDEKTFDDVVDDIYAIKKDIVKIKSDIVEIRNDIAQINLDIKKINTTIESVRADLQQQIDKNAGEIAALDYDKASKETDFMTPVTESNKGATMTEVNNINQHISALEGVGGLLSPYDFGKTFENPITAAADIQAILSYFIGQIWEGATDIVFNTADYAQTTFKDATGGEHTAAEIFNATAVTNSFDNTRIQLNNTQNTDPKVFEFTNQGILLVGIATETVAGIVRAGPKGHIVVNSETGDVILNSDNATNIRDTIGAMDRRLAELVDDLSGDEKYVILEKLGINNNSGGSGISNGTVFFTARTDNELNGAVEANGVHYNLSDINGGNNNLKDLLSRGALPYVSLAQHAADIEQNGSCRAFGWDGDNAFAVPKIAGRYLVREENDVALPSGNGTCSYRVFSNGDAEIFIVGSPISAAAQITYTLPITMANADYVGFANAANSTASGGAQQREISMPNRTTTSFSSYSGTGGKIMGIFGKAAPSEYTQDKWNVADIQANRAMVQLFNGATDSALATATGVLADVAELKNMMANIAGRFLVRRKEPTDTDWSGYEIYSDGYCRQFAKLDGVNGATVVPLAVKMANTNYDVQTTRVAGATTTTNVNLWVRQANTTDSITLYSSGETGCIYVVDGYAAPSEYAQDKWNVRPSANGLLWLPTAPKANGDYSLGLIMKDGEPTPYWGQTFVQPPSAPQRYLVRMGDITSSQGGPMSYRVYSNGDVEMWGELIAAATGNITMQLPVKMANTTYSTFAGLQSNTTDSNPTSAAISTFEKTTTSFGIRQQNTGPKSWALFGKADPTEYTRDKWGDDTDYTQISVMTGDPSPFKFKAWTNAGGETVYTLLAVPIARGDDMYTEDQLAVYNEWDANQSTAPLPKVEDRCGALGIVNGNRAINGGGVQMGTPGELDATTAYVRNQALDTNGPDWFPGDDSTFKGKAWTRDATTLFTASAKPKANDALYLNAALTDISQQIVIASGTQGAARTITDNNGYTYVRAPEKDGN